MYPSVVDDNGPSRPVWLTLQQIFLLVHEEQPRGFSDLMNWLTNTLSGCQNGNTNASRSSLLSADNQTDRQPGIQCADKIPHPREIATNKNKRNVVEKCLSGRSFFKRVDWQSARPLIERGCVEGPAVGRKWHKSRVKLNVLTVSGRL